MSGYHGRILDLNLSSGEMKEEKPDPKMLRQYIGGSGLGARLLMDNTDGDTDPLGPGNILIFATGPLTGSRVPTSGRHAVLGKSPLTGVWGESDVGGNWGTALKKAGYDALIIRGRAPHPVYIHLDEEGARIENADHLWGQDTFATEVLLKQENGEGIEAACIGPAGEQQVLLASIMHDGRHSRAAGRTGLGAVMGSKNLKALSVEGQRSTPLAHPGELKKNLGEKVRGIRENLVFLSDYGTTGGIISLEETGDLPIKNWLQGKWPQVEALSGEKMAETMLKKKFFCGACPIGCGREIEYRSEKFGPIMGAGPEYETVSTLGSYCLVDDLEAVAAANELCNRYGMDTISTGAAVAFAIEAFQEGLIGVEETGGLHLDWGAGEAVVEMVRQIGEKKGLGALLGQGVRAAAAEIGPRAEEMALHVKGLELPAHDPRAFNSVGLSYATSNRGACHLAGMTHALEGSIPMPELGYPEIPDRFGTGGKGQLVARMQDLMGLFDSLKLCKFLLFAGVEVGDALNWCNLVTGWDLNQKEFLKAGERMFNLKRMYNVGCGISRKDDLLPPRVLTHPRGTGGAAHNLPRLGEMLREYYEYRGWDEMGLPTREKLEELELEYPWEQ